MNLYEDSLVMLDERGIRIGEQAATSIPYSQIRRVRPVRLGLGSGRFRLVGISPLRPRSYFHRDGRRGRKGQRHRIGCRQMAPSCGHAGEDPERVLKLVRAKIGGWRERRAASDMLGAADHEGPGRVTVDRLLLPRAWHRTHHHYVPPSPALEAMAAVARRGG